MIECGATLYRSLAKLVLEHTAYTQGPRQTLKLINFLRKYNLLKQETSQQTYFHKRKSILGISLL